MMETVRAALVLSRVEGLGPRIFATLVARFGSAAGALGAGRDALGETEGVSAALAERVASGEADHGAWAERELARAKEEGVRILAHGEEDYPALLFAIPDPPPVLWVKGDASTLAADTLAIVGSRRASDYGLEVAERFASQIAASGVVIASGLARGIDTRAHEGALLGGGRTVAVLGAGIDVPYPPENRELAKRIALHGALVSEFPPGTLPSPGHFPRRNRVLAGLSWGVLVVEATSHSGSLITASLARAYGREVFAIPGRIDSATSRGTNDLLKDAAVLVTDVSDIVENLRPFAALASPESGRATKHAFAPDEETLLKSLSTSPRPFDEIARDSGLGAGVLASTLTGLALKGYVEERPGNRFARRAATL
ncbi:MAG: DNA-protecting protein DprA [Planctomycetes bacterium]|nr:DNA-protecting protein DprA [Planctomycetota bacterium]